MFSNKILCCIFSGWPSLHTRVHHKRAYAAGGHLRNHQRVDGSTHLSSFYRDAFHLDPFERRLLTTLQILVLVKTFIMASKGPAEEYIAAKMKRMKEDNQRIGTDPRTEMETVKNESQGFTQCFCLTTDVESYHEMGIGRKLRLLGKYSVVSQYSVALEDPLYYFPCYLDLWIRNITCILAVRSCFIFSVSAAELPFYTSSTTFRVLSMSCVITSFEFISIPVYGVLILIIVIIGYMMTSKEKDFLVRGLKSANTTGICAIVKYII